MDGQPDAPDLVEVRTRTRLARYASSLPEDLAAALREEPAALVERGQLLRSNGARRTVLLTFGEERYVLKHYVEPTWHHSLKRLILPTRAWACWRTSYRLAGAGISTPKPLACIENRWGPLRRDSFLMYGYVEGETLRSYLSDKRREPHVVDSLWRQLTSLWNRMRELRVSLADTNMGNFIVSPGGRLWVIDLDKTRFHSHALLARRHQQRAWRQVLRSAARCGFVA